MSFEKRPSSSVTVQSVPPVKTNIVDGDVTMDSGWSPFCQSGVEVPVTTEEVLDLLDPHARRRVTVTASSGDTLKSFDLVLRGRSVDHKRKTLTLDLASDEAILQDYRQLVHDSGARAYENDLRGLVNYVLRKAIPGAALQPGTTNAAIPAAWDATNLIISPRYPAHGGTAWGQSGVSTLADTIWPGPTDGLPLQGIHLHTPTTNDGWVDIGPTSGMAFGVQVGKTYVLSATGSVRGLMTGASMTDLDQNTGTSLPRQRALVIHASGTGFSPAYKVWHSPQIPNVVESGTSAGTRVSVRFTVPPDTLHVFLRAYHGATGGAISWSKFQLVEVGPGTPVEDAAFFYGAKPTDPLYTYSWRGVVDGSATERKAKLERLPSLFVWKAGVTAWDFLEPLLVAAGLRLFCDENRRWYLVDPATYEVPGRFAARPGNTADGSDDIDLDANLGGFTGVVIYYRWDDTDGSSREEIDTAGTSGRVKVLEFESPYPGPGAAAAHLKKLAGAGRTQSVTVGADFTVRPGQEVSISLPATDDQVGRLVRVQWQLGDAALMTLGSAGLIEATNGSWLQGYQERTWASTPDTQTWANQP